MTMTDQADAFEERISEYLDMHWSTRLDGVDQSCMAAGLALYLAAYAAPCDHCVVIDGWCSSCGEPRTHAARLSSRHE